MSGTIAVIIFVVTLGLILFDRVNRTIAALAGAVAMVVTGRILGFYSEADALAAIDFTTLGLLLGMMVVVALLEPTGLFEYVALYAGRLSRGRPWRLLVLLSTFTAVVSMLIDNVTTVVVIAPVTLVIARTLRLDPMPLLMAEAMFSNIGGTATLIGDPPNIIIGTAAGLSFNDFLTHALPVIVVVFVAALPFARFLFRRHLSADQTAPLEVLQLQPAKALRQPEVARRVVVVLGVAVVLFVLQERLRISPAFVAIGAAAGGLLLVRPDVNETLDRVRWGVLLFFAALFVMVGGLEHAGVLEQAAGALGHLAGANTLLFGVCLIWIMAVLSSMVDNIPLTIAMVPVIAGLQSRGVDIAPLWWAIAFGVGLGGNGTIIGASANVVVVSISEQTDAPIQSREWMKYGLPMLFFTCAVASVMYVALYPLMTW